MERNNRKRILYVNFIRVYFTYQNIFDVIGDAHRINTTLLLWHSFIEVQKCVYVCWTTAMDFFLCDKQLTLATEESTLH